MNVYPLSGILHSCFCVLCLGASCFIQLRQKTLNGELRLTGGVCSGVYRRHPIYSGHFLFSARLISVLSLLCDCTSAAIAFESEVQSWLPAALQMPLLLG